MPLAGERSGRSLRGPGQDRHREGGRDPQPPRHRGRLRSGNRNPDRHSHLARADHLPCRLHRLPQQYPREGSDHSGRTGLHGPSVRPKRVLDHDVPGRVQGLHGPHEHRLHAKRDGLRGLQAFRTEGHRAGGQQVPRPHHRRLHRRLLGPLQHHRRVVRSVRHRSVPRGSHQEVHRRRRMEPKRRHGLRLRERYGGAVHQQLQEVPDHDRVRSQARSAVVPLAQRRRVQIRLHRRLPSVAAASGGIPPRQPEASGVHRPAHRLHRQDVPAKRDPRVG
mmetsp:Transcript_3346/g.8926  ORF Transcript_3346/g.8926 Transcript_3346/m.8926 type:complete len:277 (+) Transcript_3346:143-973(+)